MEAAEISAVTERLKREEFQRTKHDTHFSKWQILIGPTDWEDYSQGKEGAARYRVHNLPTISGPGIYELGILVSRSGLGHNVGKLDPNDIVVVYLGQADKIRTRLQRYGRSGAHLGNDYSADHWNDSEADDSLLKKLGLFEEIFSRGHSIVFRWASTKDKRDAEKTESELLETFDYAWNKSGNGTRRSGDILQNIDEIASSNPNISKKLLFFSPGQVGIKIKASKPGSAEKCTIPADEITKNFLSGILKFSKSQPRLVSDKCGINEDFIHVCGFIMDDGIPCRRPPVPGRKRCEEHKGRRIYGSNTKSITENSHFVPQRYLDVGVHPDQDNITLCGVNLGEGKYCKRPPVAGRKRCEEHKGMRASSKFITDGDSHCVPHSYVDFGIHTDEDNITSCGVNLGAGKFCKRQPVAGRKRCEEHKGTRASSKSITEGNSHSVNHRYVDFGIHTDQYNITSCGVNLGGGKFCKRQPVVGRKRCEEHKGMRVNSLIPRGNGRR